MKFKVLSLAAAIGVCLAGNAAADVVQYNVDSQGNDVALPLLSTTLLSQNGQYITYATTTNVRQWNRYNNSKSTVLSEYALNFSMSDNAKSLAFISKIKHSSQDVDASLPDVYVKNLTSGSYSWISKTPDTPSITPVAMSSNGLYVAYRQYNDYNLYIANTQTGDIKAVQLSSLIGTIAISADGSTVAVSGGAVNSALTLVDTTTLQQTVISNNVPQRFALSEDGRFVVFAEGDLTTPKPIKIYDRKTSQVTNLFIKANGAAAKASPSVDSSHLAISGDGRYISFVSSDSDLVQNDNNGVADTFVFDRIAYSVTRVSVNNSGSEINSSSNSVSMSADGHYISFKTNGKLDGSNPNTIYGYVAANPLFVPEYCIGYTTFTAN